jgi:hypothetical protein
MLASRDRYYLHRAVARHIRGRGSDGGEGRSVQRRCSVAGFCHCLLGGFPLHGDGGRSTGPVPQEIQSTGRVGQSHVCQCLYGVHHHQPVLIFLGLALSGIRLPHLLKFALVAPVAVALSFLTAHYIRKPPLARRIL